MTGASATPRSPVAWIWCASRLVGEIATVQTTSIDDAAGLIRLTTTLAHSSGEWVSSDWPVCPVSETAAPHRLGAALTYARRYALFTLVGIAGEDDLDAPDLNSASDGAALSLSAKSGDEVAGPTAAAAPATGSGRRKTARQPRVMLGPDDSRKLREQLIAEVDVITDAEALTAWAERSLPQKNKLVTSDAEAVEAAFGGKLEELDAPEQASTSLDSETGSASSSESPSPKLNGHAVRSKANARVPVTPISKTLRLQTPITSNSSARSPAWPAAAARRMPITWSSRKAARSAARSAMNSPCRCVVRITGTCIDAATNGSGGSS
jgi:hypothetical protein